MKQAYVTLAARGRKNQLYAGVTAELASCRGGGKLLWFELCPTLPQAKRRAAAIRRWNRACKIAVINRANPGWRDLSTGQTQTPR